jgi:hypothetical protein
VRYGVQGVQGVQGLGVHGARVSLSSFDARSINEF